MSSSSSDANPGSALAAPAGDSLDLAHHYLLQGDHQALIDILWPQASRPVCRALLVEVLIADRDLARFSRLPGTSSDATQAALEVAIRAHVQGNPGEAVTRCQAILQQNPDNARAFNHLGRALFNLGRRDEALSAFQRAADLDSAYAPAINNLGHAERAQGRHEQALGHFRRAVELAPGFVEARMNLGIALLAQTQPDEALVQFEAVLRLRPGHPEATVNAGSSLHMLRRYAEAEAHYRFAMESVSPPIPLAMRQLGKLYIETARIDLAIEVFERIVSLLPDAPDVRAELVSTLEVANRLDEAERHVQAALARFPNDAVLNYEAAKLERRRGQGKAALARLQAISPQRIPPHLQQWFHFELGTALDGEARYDEAFAAYTVSNSHARNGMRARMTDWQALDRIFDSLQDWASQGCPAPASGEGEDLGEDLVFLLGFPRSGTTLLDLMLDGHPAVQSLEERQTIEPVFWQVDHRYGRFPHGFAEADAAGRQSLRALYRRRLAEEGIDLTRGGLIVDKMPMRSPYAGFIHRLFPRARLLFSLRHPLDVVLSNFMQNYAANEVFVHFTALDEVARVYARTMQIWLATRPLLPESAWTTVRYEDLVEDRDAVLQRVCTFLGIEWQAEMGDHLRTLSQRPHIKTNSYQQVTQPIYRRSSGRWRHYTGHLQPVMPILAPLMQTFGYIGAEGDAGGGPLSPEVG